MAWTTPRTWVTDELVTASIMNTHVRDNLDALKSPPSASYVLNQGSDYTTTSTSFVNVDGTNLSLGITTSGGAVMVGFHGTVDADDSAAKIHFEVEVDGARNAGDDGIVFVENHLYGAPVSFVRLITGLSAAAHTFKLQWKTSAGTATLFAGAGTSGKDVHPQFWVREVS